MRRLILQTGLAVLGIILWSSTAEAVIGGGVRGGVQVRGGTLTVVGIQLERPILPLATLRPTFEYAKGSGLTIFNPGLDLIVDLKYGIAPRAYVGVGVGFSSIRTSANFISSKANFNALGGVRFGIVPTVQAFIEVKGVFIQSSRSARIIGGVAFSL
jgi:hypothetical protein